MPTWNNRLDIYDIFHDDEISLAEKSTAITERIKKASWYEESNYNGELEMILEEMTDAAEEDDVDWWDKCWDAFYGIADADRIWVKTT